MKTHSQRGFTLLELLTALTIVGILLGIGVPSFVAFSRTNTMAAAANGLLTGLMTARTEAVKRHTPVTVCLSTNPTAATPGCALAAAGGQLGFVVWVDSNGDHSLDAGEKVLMQRSGPSTNGTLRVSDDLGYITYAANGFPSSANPHVSDVVFCDERGNNTSTGGVSAARAIRIEQTGRAQVMREVAEVTPAIAVISAAGVTSCP